MKKFLASVGNAQLLGKKNGELVHIADVRTLTESTLSFSTTMEEIRAGEGAQLYGRFSHDSGMTVSLTDAMFDLNYIALQVGSEIEGNATAFKTETIEASAIAEGIATLQKTPTVLGTACGLDKVVVWIRAKGCKADDAWIATTEVSGKAVTIPAELDTTNGVCVRYFVEKPEARQVAIKSNFIPAECVLLLTTKLFAGDANAPETGKPVGEITVKIPRFQLDGQFDLSMAMSSAASMSLNGTAAAVSDGTCDGSGVYAEIVEVETDSDFTNGLKMLAVDRETAEAGMTPAFYGIYNDGHTSKLDNADLSIDPALSAGGTLEANKLYTIKATDETTDPSLIVEINTQD